MIEAAGQVGGTARLINLLGSVCKEVEITSSSMELRLDDLSEGIYFLRISNEEKQYVTKVLIYSR